MSVPGGSLDLEPLDPTSPLASLGLVDPTTGKALETEEWNPATGSTEPAANTSDDGTSDLDSNAGTVGAAPTDRSTPQGSDAISAPTSPPNPYAPPASVPTPLTREQGQQVLQTEHMNIDRMALEAYNHILANGINGQQVDPAYAQQLIGAHATAMKAQAERNVMERILLPAARETAAKNLATKYSLPNAAITADELLTEGTPQAMEARAKALQDERRKVAFDGRKADGRDKAEGPAPATKATAEAREKLSASQLIALGLRRGE